MRNSMFKKGLVFILMSLLIGVVFVPTSFSVGNSSSLNDGLVGHWKFDEETGNVAYDSSVNGNDGLVQGATWNQGVIGNCLRFDGDGDYVDFPQTAIDDIEALSQGTISLWFNYRYIVGQKKLQPFFYIGRDNQDVPQNHFIIEIGHFNVGNRKLYVTWIVDGDIPLCFDSGFNLNENRWYHFAVVVGPEGNTGYLDGFELVNRHYNFGGSTDDYFLNDIPYLQKFNIGYGSEYPPFIHYKGLIDDVRIYDRPLSSEEIYELYNGSYDTELSINVINEDGLSVVIGNIGNKDAVNVAWTVDVNVRGFIFGLNTEHLNGAEERLLVGEEIIVKLSSGLLLGLGQFEINIAVNADNAMGETESIKGMVLFFLILL